MSATDPQPTIDSSEDVQRRLFTVSQAVVRRSKNDADRLADGAIDQLAGWDLLAQAITGDPALRVHHAKRSQAVQQMMKALRTLRETEFVVVALRFGLVEDNRVRSRRDVSQVIERSHSRVAQLERDALGQLRQVLLERGDTLMPYLTSDASSSYAVGDVDEHADGSHMSVL